MSEEPTVVRKIEIFKPNERQPTQRSLKLLDLLQQHSMRTRFIVIALNFFSVIVFAAALNEKFGGTRPRTEVRFWSSRIETLNCLINRTPTCSGSLPGHAITSALSSAPSDTVFSLSAPDWIEREFASKDDAELAILRQAQLSQFETVTIPLVGIVVSATDVSLLAGVALLIIYIWFKLAISRERRVLTLLIYPLSAKVSDKQAQFYWGIPPEITGFTEQQRIDWLTARLDDYRNDIMALREAISSQFVFLYSKSGRAVLERCLGLFLTILPVGLLFVSVGMDFYWDFSKGFKETGATYAHEIAGYARNLSKFAVQLQEQGMGEAATKLESAASDLEAELWELRVKRMTAALLLLMSAGLSVLVWLDANRMGDALTAMYTSDDVPKPKIE